MCRKLGSSIAIRAVGRQRGLLETEEVGRSASCVRVQLRLFAFMRAKPYTRKGVRADPHGGTRTASMEYGVSTWALLPGHQTAVGR